jgi:hypothetical protein
MVDFSTSPTADGSMSATQFLMLSEFAATPIYPGPSYCRWAGQFNAPIRHFAGDAEAEAEAEERANAIAELEVSQAVTVPTNLILESSTIVFDTLGASSTRKPTGLDRHWRG